MKNFLFSALAVAFVHFSIAQDGVGIGITAPLAQASACALLIVALL